MTVGEAFNLLRQLREAVDAAGYILVVRERGSESQYAEKLKEMQALLDRLAKD